MTTTPDAPVPDDADESDEAFPETEGTAGVEREGAPGAEVGMSEEGSTFEPEEDPEGYG